MATPNDDDIPRDFNMGSSDPDGKYSYTFERPTTPDPALFHEHFYKGIDVHTYTDEQKNLVEQHVLGKALKDIHSNIFVREISIDGKYLRTTKDRCETRVNVHIEKDIVTKVDGFY